MVISSKYSKGTQAGLLPIKNNNNKKSNKKPKLEQNKIKPNIF